MRPKWMAVAGILLLATQVNSEETLVLKTENEKVSYAVGVDTARSLKESKIQADIDALIAGMRDVFSGQKLLISEAELPAVIRAYQEELNQGKGKKMSTQVSYAVGVDMAKKFRPLDIEFNVDVLARGLRDFASGKKLLIDGNELRLTINAVQLELKQKRNQARTMPAKVRENGGKEGRDFLARNKTKEGIITLPSGLQYRIIKAGDGRKPTEADTVEVNYRGTLVNGTEFDGSKPGQPEAFEVIKVIPGWREALRLMPVGSKWQLFIPPELGYGLRGKDGKVGPNATLIFEIELLSIK